MLLGNLSVSWARAERQKFSPGLLTEFQVTAGRRIGLTLALIPPRNFLHVKSINSRTWSSNLGGDVRVKSQSTEMFLVQLMREVVRITQFCHKINYGSRSLQIQFILLWKGSQSAGRIRSLYRSSVFAKPFLYWFNCIVWCDTYHINDMLSYLQ